jgi:hypothetical protein
MTISLPCPPSASPEEQERAERAFAIYRQELPQLLAQGHAGRFILIHGEQIHSIWDTQSDAIQAGRLLFGMGPIAVQKINPLDVQRFALLDARTGHDKEAECLS